MLLKDWIDWYLSNGKNKELTCRHFGISKSLFYRWFQRFDKRNLRSLEFDSKTRRPHKLREMTTPQWIKEKIYDIRKNDPEKSKYEIQKELLDQGVHAGQTAIGKIIRRHPELWNTQHKKKIQKHRNYKIARIRAGRELREKELGSLVQIDTKHLFVLGNRFYILVAIDCKTRFAYTFAYTTISSLSASDFLKRVLEEFPFQVKAVNTDNGSEYLFYFHKLCEELSIKHYFTYPHTPKMNSRVERLIKTMSYEFLYHQELMPEIDDVREKCLQFNQKYNKERLHQALDYKTPFEYLMLYQQQKGELYGI